MAKDYKRKWMQEENSRDSRAPKMEGSERPRAKREYKKELEDYEIKDMNKIRYDLEMEQAMRCYRQEKETKKQNKKYKCTCIDPWKMTDEEVLKKMGY